MSMKINPPVFKKACNYERYKQELLAWREITDLDKKKQGIAIALTLPENDETKIRERVFDELPLSDLKQDSGFDKLLCFLDKHLGKDDLEDSLSKFEDFEDYIRNCDQPINDYIVNFDQKYNRILKKGEVNDLVRASKVINKIKSEHSEILFSDLGHPSCWKILAFTDAAHANLADGVSSTMGHVIFLTDNKDLCCPITWKANKIKRVVRSTLAAEALSLQEGLEAALYIKTLVLEIVGSKIELPITAFVDNKSVIEAIHSTKLVDDKRLRIDIGAIKQSLENKEVHSVKWCPGSIQLANCLTKRGASGKQLLAIFQGGKINFAI